MTTSTTGQSRCSICGKRSNIICGGCLQMFCQDHYTNHHQQTTAELYKIENDRDQFKQLFNEQKKNPNKSALIKQINQWEEMSIKKIQEAARDCRQLLIEYGNKYNVQIETKLTRLTEKIRKTRQENEFNENDVKRLKEKLTELSKELDQPQNVLIKEVNECLVKKIAVLPASSFNRISENARWKQNGDTIAGGHRQGGQNNQLYHPSSIYVDENQSLFVADRDNHRIVRWKSGSTTGEIVAGGNGKGNRTDQLNSPRDVIVDNQTNSIIICDTENRRVMQWSLENGRKNGEILIDNIDCRRLTIDDNRFLYISDWEINEVRQYRIGEKNGIIVAGGNGKGDRLNQLNQPTFIFVDGDYSVYVSDGGNNRVMKWLKGATAGILVAGGKGQGNSLSQLYYPQGLFVDSFGTLYVAEEGNNRVNRWRKGAKEGEIVVGRNGRGGEGENQFNKPIGLSLDRHGYFYVVDSNNHRVQRFSIDSN